MMARLERRICAINMGQSPDLTFHNTTKKWDNGPSVLFFRGNADFGEINYPAVRKKCGALSATKIAREKRAGECTLVIDLE